LHYTTGADAIGSLTSGFAALGREVSRTADGARMRTAIATGRAGSNGNALWSALLIGEWASGLPPAPILDHLRNDLALLLADDLETTLENPGIPSDVAGTAGTAPEPATFVDCILGMWAFAREVIRGVEALAAPTLPPAGTVTTGAGRPPEPEGELLR
jgi:hypothetical protein